jgi:hypothetical protein
MTELTPDLIDAALVELFGPADKRLYVVEVPSGSVKFRRSAQSADLASIQAVWAIFKASIVQQQASATVTITASMDDAVAALFGVWISYKGDEIRAAFRLADQFLSDGVQSVVTLNPEATRFVRALLARKL